MWVEQEALKGALKLVETENGRLRSGSDPAILATPAVGDKGDGDAGHWCEPSTNGALAN